MSEHRRPTTAEWPVLDEIRKHVYQYWEKGTVSEKLGDPGWHRCSCGWEGYWTDWQPHVAQMVVGAVDPALRVMGQRLEQRSEALNRTSEANQELREQVAVLERRVAGLSEVVDASLAVEMALMDCREAIGRVETLVQGWEAEGVFPLTRKHAADVRAALAEPVEESEGEGDEVRGQ